MKITVSLPPNIRPVAGSAEKSLEIDVDLLHVDVPNLALDTPTINRHFDEIDQMLMLDFDWVG